MKYIVWDCEANGLTPDKFYCLSFKTSWGEKGTLTDYEDIRSFFSQEDVYYVGHNIRRWDLPNLGRVVGVETPRLVVDTLFLSFYVNHNRRRHGLEDYGVEFGVPKPKIIDWEGQTLSEYIHRCEQDVEINYKLFEQQLTKLKKIYGSEEDILGILGYLDFKARCARLAEESGWKLDQKRCHEGIERLERIRQEKIDELRKALPPVPIKKERTKPRVLRKADGELSVAGRRWEELTLRAGVDLEFDGVIEEIVGYDEPNPNSTDQVKDWLFSLGWKPQTFKEVRNAEGEVREIPQINLERGEGVCPSVLALADKNPSVSALEGIGVLSHRIGILKGFLRDVDQDGYLHARVAGLTNTLRFKHAEIVNLPKPDKAFSEDIRSALICEDDEVLCGSDMSSLEDKIKQHQIHPYDPEYVNELNTEGYDPHLDIAKMGGFVTEEDILSYKKGEKPEVKKIRDLGKTTNYGCQYGAGAAKIAKTTGLSLKEARALHKAYWDKNWAVKEFASRQYVKEVDGEMWVYNQVSGFYYSLRYEKDIFSTLTQSTGVFCFDLWLKRILSVREQLTATFHDEIVLTIKKGAEEKCTELINKAMDEVNDILQLNVRLGCEIQYGHNYARIH